MPQQQLPYVCFFGYGGSLRGGAMEIFACPFGMLIGIGRLVVEHVNSLYKLMQVGQIARVAAIGIRANRVGVERELFVRYHLPFGCSPVEPLPDKMQIGYRDVVGIGHSPVDVSRGFFLAEEEPTA